MDSKRCRIAFAIAFLLGAAACETPTAWNFGIPGWKSDFTVESVQPRAGYLDVSLEGGDVTLRRFAPDAEPCRRMLQPGAKVGWEPSGAGGEFKGGDETCHSVGIGSLADWRDRRPRSANLRSRAVQSAQASYRVLHRDGDVVLVRGRFPLAALLHWAGSSDTVAVLPNTPECAQAIESGVATMEFFSTGRRALTLVSGEGRCEILGLALPVSG